MPLSSAVNPTWFAYRLGKCVRFYHKNQSGEFKELCVVVGVVMGEGKECVMQMCETRVG